MQKLELFNFNTNRTMGELFNIYCDESCHLEHDPVNVTAMVVGGILCPDAKKKEANDCIREIKKKHGVARDAEIKWNKVSPGKLDYYLELVEFFFNNPNLHFRAIVIPDKRELCHKNFNQTHDDFYYKAYFNMLKTMFEPDKEYAIYIDIKDTRSQQKVCKLHDILCNNHYDFNRDILKKVQQIRSNEVELMGLTDLLIGAISYLHRNFTQSEAKMTIIEKIKELSGYNLRSSTLYRELKFNLFIWHPKNGINQ